MKEKAPLLGRIIAFAQEPKNYRWLVPLFVCLILAFVVKGCLSKKTKENSIYVIARDATWYPLNFYGKEKNILAFSDDLMLEIAKKKGLKIRLVTVNPGDLLESLDDEADGAFTSITPDIILQDRYLFSDAYYDLGMVLVVDVRSSASSLSDLAGRYVGIRRGSTALYSIPGRPVFSVIQYDSLNQMLEDVARDKIDGALLNQLNAYNFTAAYFKGVLKVATLPLTNEGLRLLAPMGRKGTLLIQVFNEGLAEIKADGTYSSLLKKWDLHDPTQKL